MNDVPPSPARPFPRPALDMGRLLAQDVVIDGETAGPATGAQRMEPSHSPRATLAGQPAHARPVPRAEAMAAPDLHREVEQLPLPAGRAARRQALASLDRSSSLRRRRLLDAGWRLSRPEWDGTPSIFVEEHKLLMEIRKGRVSHPNAWSQAPQWETSHLVSHVTVESNEATARSPCAHAST